MLWSPHKHGGAVGLGKESETWYGAGCHGLTVGWVHSPFSISVFITGTGLRIIRGRRLPYKAINGYEP